jgi:hypothetical protein
MSGGQGRLKPSPGSFFVAAFAKPVEITALHLQISLFAGLYRREGVGGNRNQ